MPLPYFRWTVFLAFSLSAVVMVHNPAHGQSLKGAKEALTFFESISAKWEEILMPLARRQAARDLRRLSNSLEDLALDKQEFTESLLAARSDMDNETTVQINERIEAFKDTTWRLRRNIRRFTSNLPGQYQDEGRKIAQQLFTDLSTKWQTLDELAQWVTGNDTFSAQQIKAETRQLVATLLALKDITDTLAAKLGSGAPPE